MRLDCGSSANPKAATACHARRLMQGRFKPFDASICLGSAICACCCRPTTCPSCRTYPCRSSPMLNVHDRVA
eukprot:scaffold62909_cov39-Tisochrysis_lutea.AAC.2